jgi:acyl-[acyl-carrier-protein]-phospholipid O-acyltransferase/long-chain-fatty-acid--[acyl-carrier-protein] ligase
MAGYINPDANSKFAALDGWYDTGDIVHVDEDGFIQILGRVKRFAKISGEMVSINALEETLAQILQPANQRLQIAIVNVPDPFKGERLIAVTNDKDLTINKIQNHLKNSGFSTLVYPSELIYFRRNAETWFGQNKLS